MSRKPNADRALRHLRQQMYDAQDRARRNDPPLPGPVVNPLVAMDAFIAAYTAPLPRRVRLLPTWAGVRVDHADDRVREAGR